MSIKMNISHLPGDNVQQIMDLLKPILPNAKIRISKDFKPYKHIYITLINADESSKINGFR